MGISLGETVFRTSSLAGRCFRSLLERLGKEGVGREPGGMGREVGSPLSGENVPWVGRMRGGRGFLSFLLGAEPLEHRSLVGLHCQPEALVPVGLH